MRFTTAIRPRKDDAFAEYNLQEQRTYGGVQAAELAEHALDIEAEKCGRNRHGAFERLARVTTEFIQGFHIYKRVKSALRLFFKPIPPRTPSPRTPAPRTAKPRAKIIWQGHRPSAQDWANLDRYYDCDVRGTSPTWIERRVKAARQKVRAAMEPAVTARVPSAPIAERSEIIKQFKSPSDLLAIWPPIQLPEIEKPNDQPSQVEEAIVVKAIKTAQPTPKQTPPKRVEVSLFQNMVSDYLNNNLEPMNEPPLNRKARRRAAKLALKTSRGPP